MNRSLHHLSFAVGLAAVAWVGAGYVAASPLALAMTVLVGAFFLMGALELQRFHLATLSLSQALAALPDVLPDLRPWLERLHPSLRQAVRLRIEGERVGLPGPAMTPYLAGLLVLLGMLGTFLGMVVTLQGTGAALDGASDVQAIRASLSAPVKGLGLAFGTSVAGVAASAMLGLMSALCRRDRQKAAQALDGAIATSLRAFSLAHQREASLRLLQQQAEVMPALVDRLQAMASTMERQGEALQERLVAGQALFHRQAEAAYSGLASSVDQTLKHSLTESARIAGATLQPAVDATLAGIAQRTAALHDALGGAVQQQLHAMSSRFEASTATVSELWQAALAEHRRSGEAVSQDLRRTLDGFADTFGQRSSALADYLEARLAARDEQRLAAWTQTLDGMAAGLQREWQQAGAQSLSQQQQICRTLEHTARDITAQAEAQASRTLGEIATLVHTASQAPRAAADVIAELRQQLSESMVRDNAVLEERSRIMATLGAMLEALNHASAGQRGAIDALVASSAAMLERAGARFSEDAGAHAERLSEVAAQVTGSAVEVASLGEAFGHSVELFGQANDKLLAHLQRVEGTLSKSIARSDEQLAYYVAQAREVIDLSIMSQRQIVDDLQQLSSRGAPVGEPA